MTFRFYFILLYLLVSVTVECESKNPCAIIGSEVSFTQYLKVSDNVWNEYYESLTKDESNTQIKLRRGYIPISHYTYHNGQPFNTNCSEGLSLSSPQHKSNTNSSTTQICTEHRAGLDCDSCEQNFFKNPNRICTSCHCNLKGSLSGQCDGNGKCPCKPGVGGNHCNECSPGFHTFGQDGCNKCNCSNAGVDPNHGTCDPVNGVCRCKDNVSGSKCDVCKPGHFNLSKGNVFGCSTCFCFGHSTVCESAEGYGKVVIQSSFKRGAEKWRAEDSDLKPFDVQFSSFAQNLKINASGQNVTGSLCFSAPDRFLGNQRFSYNQMFSFSLRSGDFNPVLPTSRVVLEGSVLRISREIIGLSNYSREFRFTLNEYSDWYPVLSTTEFNGLLSNLTALKICGIHSSGELSYLDNVKLETARRGAAGESARWIETCTCPEGYHGQFCENCADGFFRDSTAVTDKRLSKCIPCICNSHGKTCEDGSGNCLCEDNTEGLHCEKCMEGYYGNPLNRTTNDCKPCDCLNFESENCSEFLQKNTVCPPKHVSSIIFLERTRRVLPSAENISEVHDLLSKLTSQEVEDLPGFEYVKDASIHPQNIMSDEIRKK